MRLGDYLKHDGVGLAGLVARREASPQELLDVALQQNERAHPKINAVCRLMDKEARAQLARPLSGPFAGVPFLIKDIAQDYAGLPTSSGSRSMLSVVPGEYAHVVRRYLEAGLIVFGKTNLPEFALKASHGLGPFRTHKQPLGLQPDARRLQRRRCGRGRGGNRPDGGRQRRRRVDPNPRSLLWPVRLKPSRGRASLGPAAGEVWFGASSEGVISRSVRDTAAALDVLAGGEPGDPFVVAPPEASYAEMMRREPGVLRIGFASASPIGTEVHPEAVAAVADAAALLESLGHEIEEAAPEIDGAALAKSYMHIYFGQIGATVAQARPRGAKRTDFELLSRLPATLGGALSAGALTTQLLKWNDFARALGRFHQRYDMLLTPAIAHPPIRHGQGDLDSGAKRNEVKRSGFAHPFQARQARLGMAS